MGKTKEDTVHAHAVQPLSHENRSQQTQLDQGKLPFPKFTQLDLLRPPGENEDEPWSDLSDADDDLQEPSPSMGWPAYYRDNKKHFAKKFKIKSYSLPQVVVEKQ